MKTLKIEMNKATVEVDKKNMELVRFTVDHLAHAGNKEAKHLLADIDKILENPNFAQPKIL
jgi:hypothetical protein